MIVSAALWTPGSPSRAATSPEFIAPLGEIGVLGVVHDERAEWSLA